MYLLVLSSTSRLGGHKGEMTHKNLKNLMSYPERTEVRSRLHSEIQQLGFLLAFLHRPINHNFPQKTYNANFWDSKTPQDVKIDKKLRKM